MAVLKVAVAALDDRRMSAISQLTASCGSLVLALAAIAGRIGPGEATAASQLDLVWQAEKWGEDKEAAKRRQALATEIEAAMRFLELLED